MIDLSPLELRQVASAIQREVDRLVGLEAEYRGTRKPANPAVRMMADEGAANVVARIAELRSLVAKLRPDQTGKGGTP